MMKFILIFTTVALCFIQFECNATVNNNRKKTVVNKKDLPTQDKKRIYRKQKKMDKEKLAKRLQPVDETVSQLILDANSEIKMIDTPFLKDGKIYLVSNFAPTRLIEIYVGLSNQDFTELIGGDEEKYNKLIEKSGLKLNSSELRLKYVLNYLEVTKSGGDRFQILESIDDVKQRPNLDENQKQEFANFQEKYKSVIVPPKQTNSDIYIVHLVKGQDLVRYELKIKEDNLIEKKETILEQNLLIPYAI